jgi:bifunctional non-homologous end joining protein LigD
LRLNGQDLRGLPIEERKGEIDRPSEKPAAGYSVFGFVYQNIDALLTKVRELSLRLDRQTGRLQVRFEAVGREDQAQALPTKFLCDCRLYPTRRRAKALRALLVGVYDNGKLKFAGRVGTGFSEKLLKLLSAELNKIAVKDCPFDNLPATGRGFDPGLTAAEMKRCVWVKPIVVCEVKFTEWTRDDRLRHPVFLGIRGR